MLLRQVITASAAFAATNVDDIVILTLLFARLSRWRHALPLLAGQLLGFGLLVLISLIGVLGRTALPGSWLSWLGLLPILLGLVRWHQSSCGAAPATNDLAALPLTGASPLAELLAIAALRLANGSDNVGVYLPLFARAAGLELTVMLITFAVCLLLLCGAAWLLTRSPALAPLLVRYGDPLVPPLLITLGGLILLQSHILAPPGPLALVGLALGSLALAWGAARWRHGSCPQRPFGLPPMAGGTIEARARAVHGSARV